jgi:hypothetical protein
MCQENRKIRLTIPESKAVSKKLNATNGQSSEDGMFSQQDLEGEYIT